MDLLAAYDSESDQGEHSERFKIGHNDEDSPGDGIAAQQHQAETADLDCAPQSKKARLSCKAGSSKVLGAAAVNAASGQAAASVLAALPAEPERVWSFPLVEGLIPTVVYVPVPEAAAQQLQALAAELIAACTAAELATQCDQQSTASNSSSSSSSSRLLLWPTCPPVPASIDTIVGSQEELPANPQQQQQQQQEEAAQMAQSAALPLHMSLSRTVPIRYGQAASLAAALEKQLRPCRKFRGLLSGLVCLTNEPKTRSFVCLRVADGVQQVLRMVRQVDSAFTRHGLPKFYKNPIPHVSVVWTSGDQTQVLQPWLDSFYHSPVPFQVSQVQCQVGKLKHRVWEA